MRQGRQGNAGRAATPARGLHSRLELAVRMDGRCSYWLNAPRWALLPLAVLGCSHESAGSYTRKQDLLLPVVEPDGDHRLHRYVAAQDPPEVISPLPWACALQRSAGGALVPGFRRDDSRWWGRVRKLLPDSQVRCRVRVSNGGRSAPSERGVFTRAAYRGLATLSESFPRKREPLFGSALRKQRSPLSRG